MNKEQPKKSEEIIIVKEKNRKKIYVFELLLSSIMIIGNIKDLYLLATDQEIPSFFDV